MGALDHAGLEIRLLGGFEITRDGVPLTELSSERVRSLFAWMVVNARQSVTRSLVAGTFWPDLPEAKARARLRQALWRITSAVGPEVIDRTQDALRLRSEAVHVDVDEFLWAVERAGATDDPHRAAELYGQAVDLYRGDFLEGSYDDWVFPDRERLRRRLTGCLERLTDLQAAAGQRNEALAFARRLAELEPWDERAHRRVMRLAAATGRFGEALRQFETCREILERDLGVEPSEELRQQYELILADQEAGRSVSPLLGADTPLVGRDRERATAAEVLDALVAGAGDVLLIEGDVGMGKTRLLDAVVADARWRDLGVVHVRGLHQARPYEPIANALEEIPRSALTRHLDRPTLGRVVPLLGTVPRSDAPIDDGPAMREAVGRALVVEAIDRPVLLAIDEAHHLDSESVAAIRHAVDAIDRLPIVVVLAYRHTEARGNVPIWSLIREVDRRSPNGRISLGPLSPGQTEVLLRALTGGDVSATASARLHGATGGVPFLLVEAIRDAGDAEHSEPIVDAVRGVAAEMIQRRTDDLSPAALRALRVVCLHDRPARLDAMAPQTGNHIRELTGRGLVSVHVNEAEPASDLIRSAVVDSMTGGERREVHEHIARTLAEGDDADPAAVARHFAAAGKDREAVPFLIASAERHAAVHAYTEALDQLKAADEAAPEPSVAVRRSIVRYLDLLGRRAEQGQALEGLAEVASGVDAVEALRMRSRWHAQIGDFEAAREIGRQALDAARTTDDPDQEVSALAALAMTECQAGRAAEGLALLEEAAGFGMVGAQAQADARNALGQNLVDLQRFEEAETQLLAALALYRDLGDARGEVDVTGQLATIRMERGEADAAREAYERAIALSRTVGYREGEAVNLTNLGVLEALTGEVVDSLAALDQAADSLRGLGQRANEATTRLNTAWIRHSVLGDDSTALNEVARSLEIAREIGDGRAEAQAVALTGALSAARGDWLEARSQFEQSVTLARQAGDRWLECQNTAQMARAALRFGFDSDLEESLHEAVSLASDLGFADIAADLHMTTIETLLFKGEIEGALRSLDGLEAGRSALAPHRDSALRSRVLRAAGRDGEADEELETAWHRLMGLLKPFGEQAAEHALATVHEYTLLRSDWEKHAPTRVRASLPPSNLGPRTRPADDELVEVEWTIESSDDRHEGVGPERRRDRILRMLDEAESQGGVPTITDLAKVLGVSEKTIRRDISTLRLRGHQISTHGSIDRA